MEWKIARSRRLSEEGEDSVKKAKDTFSVCNDSVRSLSSARSLRAQHGMVAP